MMGRRGMGITKGKRDGVDEGAKIKRMALKHEKRVGQNKKS